MFLLAFWLHNQYWIVQPTSWLKRDKTLYSSAPWKSLLVPLKTMAKFLFVGWDKVIKMDCKWEEEKVVLQLPMGGRQGRKYQPQTQFGEVLQEKRKTFKKPGLTRGIWENVSHFLSRFRITLRHIFFFTVTIYLFRKYLKNETKRWFLGRSDNSSKCTNNFIFNSIPSPGLGIWCCCGLCLPHLQLLCFHPNCAWEIIQTTLFSHLRKVTKSLVWTNFCA